METSEKTQALVDGAMKLFSVEIDDLYAILGMQLLARAEPTRAAGIVAFLSAVRHADKAVTFIDILRPGLSQRGEWLEIVHEELKRDGVRYLTEVSGDLRAVLCNDDIQRLSQQINRSNLHVMIMVVGAALRISPDFESICATITVLLLKLGLRNLCA
ncbi:MAG: hypothetical protein ACREQ2_20940 [Candidatus Binatia bacterium]